MPARWLCSKSPAAHRSFPQWALNELARDYPDLQPKDRFACPVCWANGDWGWVEPSTRTDTKPMEH